MSVFAVLFGIELAVRSLDVAMEPELETRLAHVCVREQFLTENVEFVLIG